MFDSRTKARSLAFLFAAGALVGLLTVALPHDEVIPDRKVLGVSAVSLGLAWIFSRNAERIPDRLLHGALAAVTVILSLVIHYTEHTTLYPLIYMWPALYAFYFFSTPTALAHLAFIGVAYATVLDIDNTTDATLRLVLVLGTPLIIGMMISRLLGVTRAGFERMARQERALRSSERRTREIVDSARDGFISTDANGRVLDINAAAEELLGRSRAEVLGRPFQELGIPREEHRIFDERRRALLEGATHEHGIRHLALRVVIDRPDGTRLQGETMIWVVERDGQLTFNARLTDIGDRLREEEEREKLVRSEAARAEAERTAATIGRLQAVADAALTERDLDVLGPTILQRTREVMDAEAAALLIVQEGGSMSLVTSDSVTAARPKSVPADVGIAGRVMATRAPVVMNDPPPSDLADPTILDVGIASMLGVPLIVRDEVIGVIEIGVRKPRRLGPEDVDLLRLTADRVALAIDHARAFGREHRIAETLQRSLLPQTLPSMPGIALAARYLPAASEAEVGGDWYDAISLTGGRVLLVMGDVSGKGLAAASTLGALRNAIRAYALEGHGPAEIAGRLNGFVLADPAREHMATLVLAVFDPVDAQLSWVNAGHPPPLTLDVDGTTRYLEGARSVPLGVMPFPAYAEETVSLEAGGAVVLYTDGLIERRGEHLDGGLLLLAGAAGEGHLEPEALCDRLLAAAVPDGASSDDIALLALCHVPLGARLVLDLRSEPSALGSLRALLRRWLAQAHASDTDMHAIVMACSEACTNAIEHSGAAADDTIAFEAVLRDGEVEVTVTDRGHWRSSRPPSDQGRGLELIAALMDDVELETTERGTTVRLRRRLSERVSA